MKETNEMSGSRGEANFVWKCKNCKVSYLMPSYFHLTNIMQSENRQPLSRLDLFLMSKLNQPSLKRSSSSTAEDSNSLSSRLRYVSYELDEDHTNDLLGRMVGRRPRDGDQVYWHRLGGGRVVRI